MELNPIAREELRKTIRKKRSQQELNRRKIVKLEQQNENLQIEIEALDQQMEMG